MAPIFYIFAALTIIAALAVILQRTPVYSALSLIVVLCSLAVLYVTLDALFLAAIQVIVYAGAIMVLFVLVIMVLNAGRETHTEGSNLARWLGVPLLAALLLEILWLIWAPITSSLGAPAAWFDAGPAAIGGLLFRNYVLPFEVTSILILVAILGAVVLAKKEF
jgi:NADH-quinone oxidoreductase subunit J